MLLLGDKGSDRTCPPLTTAVRAGPLELNNMKELLVSKQDSLCVPSLERNKTTSSHASSSSSSTPPPPTPYSSGVPTVSSSSVTTTMTTSTNNVGEATGGSSSASTDDTGTTTTTTTGVNKAHRHEPQKLHQRGFGFHDIDSHDYVGWYNLFYADTNRGDVVVVAECDSQQRSKKRSKHHQRQQQGAGFLHGRTGRTGNDHPSPSSVLASTFAFDNKNNDPRRAGSQPHKRTRTDPLLQQYQTKIQTGFV